MWETTRLDKKGEKQPRPTFLSLPTPLYSAPEATQPSQMPISLFFSSFFLTFQMRQHLQHRHQPKVIHHDSRILSHFQILTQPFSYWHLEGRWTKPCHLFYEKYERSFYIVRVETEEVFWQGQCPSNQKLKVKVKEVETSLSLSTTLYSGSEATQLSQMPIATFSNNISSEKFC